MKDNQLEHKVSSLDANNSSYFKCRAHLLTKLDSCDSSSKSSFVKSTSAKVSKLQRPLLKVPPGFEEFSQNTFNNSVINEKPDSQQVMNSTNNFETTKNKLSVPPGFEPTTDENLKTANKHSLPNVSRTKRSNAPTGFENFNPKPRNIKSSIIQTNNMRKTRYAWNRTFKISI